MQTNTTTQTTGKIFQRIKLQYVTAVAGIALAASAFVAIGGAAQNKENKAPAGSAASISAVKAYSQPEASDVVFYVVTSEEQAQAIRQMYEARWDTDGAVVSINRDVDILVADSPEASSAIDMSLAITGADQLLSGRHLTVVDMRNR